MLAGGEDFAIPHRAVFFFGLLFGAIYSLNTESAFFHHAAESNGNIGILKHLDCLRHVFGIIEEIEPANFVGTVVRAIPRSDTAVVGHGIEPLFVMNRGRYRADCLARGVFALLAGHRLNHDLRIVDVADEVSVVTNPVHFASVEDLFLADHRNIVFALAGDRTGSAADAGIQIDRHTPLVAFIVFMLGEDRGQFRRFHHAGSEFGIFAILIEGGLADDGASFHGAVVLGVGEFMSFTDFFYCYLSQSMIFGVTFQLVGIETDSFGNTADMLTPVTECHGD